MRASPGLPAILIAAIVLVLGLFATVVSNPARAMSVVHQVGSTPIGTGTGTPIGSGTATATATRPPLEAYPVFPAPNHKTPHKTVHAIVIGKHLVFRPSTMRVSVGTEVIWKNTSQARGTVTSITRDWNFSKVLKPMGSVYYIFAKAGTYKYRSTLHHGLTGTVIVK